jgi:hypothetical protein
VTSGSVLRLFHKIRTAFEPVVALLKSKVVYEIADIDSLGGKGFIKLQIRERPEHGPLYTVVAKGGEATVYVVFSREQFAEFAAKANEIASANRDLPL